MARAPHPDQQSTGRGLFLLGVAQSSLLVCVDLLGGFDPAIAQCEEDQPFAVHHEEALRMFA